MNLQLPEKEKMSKQRIIIYVVIAIICVLAIFVIIGIQVLGNDIIDNIFGVNKIINRTEDEKAELKSNFEELFNNQFENYDNYSTIKIDNDQEIVYLCYNKQVREENYEINVALPYINIQNKEIQKFNTEISETFQSKAEDIIKNSDKAIYNVKYISTIKNNILSIVIYSDLKQSTNAQRVIVQTFNFDLEEKKKINFEELLKKYNLDSKKVQDIVNKDIAKEEKKAEELRNLGYNIFSRKVDDDIYKIDNISEYFVYNDNIYIIFAYGNDKLTSEMDIVII